VAAFWGSCIYDSFGDIKNVGEDMKKVKLKRLKDFVTESDIKEQVKDYLNIMGWYHFPILQGLGAFKGISDRIAIKNGRTIYLEVKKPGRKQSPEQIEFEENITRQKGEYYLIKCLEDLIKAIGRRKIKG